MIKAMTGKSEAEVRAGLSELYPRLWRFALVLTKRRDVADDLAQGAALRAIEKAHQFQAGTRLDAWVFTILSSQWKNQLRSEKVRRGEGLQPVEEVDLASDAPGAESNIFANQVLDRVMALPAGQRDAVFLTYVEGYSYKETAALLEVPIGTVMSRLATSRRKINESLGDSVTPAARGRGD